MGGLNCTSEAIDENNPQLKPQLREDPNNPFGGGRASLEGPRFPIGADFMRQSLVRPSLRESLKNGRQSRLRSSDSKQHFRTAGELQPASSPCPSQTT